MPRRRANGVNSLAVLDYIAQRSMSRRSHGHTDSLTRSVQEVAHLFVHMPSPSQLRVSILSVASPHAPL